MRDSTFAALAVVRRPRRRRHSVVLLLVQHRVELFRVVRVDRQQLVDHLPQGRVFPDPRVRVHGGRMWKYRFSTTSRGTVWTTGEKHVDESTCLCRASCGNHGEKNVRPCR